MIKTFNYVMQLRHKIGSYDWLVRSHAACARFSGKDLKNSLLQVDWSTAHSSLGTAISKADVRTVTNTVTSFVMKTGREYSASWYKILKLPLSKTNQQQYR